MKKQHIILLLCCFTLVTILAPWIINESYKTSKGYVTLWGATEMLSYAGAVIGAIGTVFIGIVAIAQSERANKISDKLLKMEEIRSTPYLHLDTASCKVSCFREHEVDIMLGFRNVTDSVINVVSVVPLSMESALSMKKTEISFAENWTEHFSVLPHQTRQFNFFDESSKRKEEAPIIDLSETEHTEGFLSLTCKLAVKIKYVNSTDIYLQKYEFTIQMRIGRQDSDKIYPTVFNNVENSICKEETTNK